MQPTIEEAIKNALEALKFKGFPPGGAVYDDLKQVMDDLDSETLNERLTA